MFPEMLLYPDVLPCSKSWQVPIVWPCIQLDDDLLRSTRIPAGFDVVCTAERARGYKPDGTLFRYPIAKAGVGLPEILHSGQSQFTDMVGGRPLGLTVAWINRRNLNLHPTVPPHDPRHSPPMNKSSCVV
jgi:2-haloacid dehalogenase